MSWKNEYSGIMSKEVLCTSLDNTSINQGGESTENSNTSCGPSGMLLSAIEGLSVDTKDENNQDLQENEQDQFDFEEDLMTGSYVEISLDQELACSKNDFQESKEQDNCHPVVEDQENSSKESSREKKRPNSLILTKNISKLDDLGSSEHEPTSSVQHVHKSQQTSEGRTTSAEASPSLSSEEFAVHSSSHRRTGSDTSGLSELQGTLTVDGDLVTFVAEDLQEKIKMSSPVSRWTDSSSFPGSRSSTPSLYRQALQPNIHLVDPNILTDLEGNAKKVATCVDRMLENLSGTLQSISSLTVGCMESYESSVCKTCDSVDVNIKAVYQLMAKCEELSNSMSPLYKISDDVKHLKKILDQLEHAVEHKS